MTVKIVNHLKEIDFTFDLRSVGKRFALITDEHVASLHGNHLVQHLLSLGLDTTLLTFPTGEQYKTRLWKEKLEDTLCDLNFNRQDAIIALGGGVVSDLAGFVAATYCRGIPYVTLPTTLMAMVDASIGGKVAINTLKAKNRIGTFYPSLAVLTVLDFLTSLPQAALKNGLAEVIKHSLITSPSLFQQLCNHTHDWDELAQLKTWVTQSISIKSAITQQDPNELGLRRILNFGHTIAHALETAANYTLDHGHAVAIGMQVEATISSLCGFLSPTSHAAILSLIKAFNYPPIAHIPKESWLHYLQKDKKSDGHKPYFVMLKDIGSVMDFEGSYCAYAPIEIIEEAIYAHQDLA